jgi:hypothetical protein
VPSEIVFIDTYSCPHCRAELETGFDDWQGWQRCPTCGLPSLPPEPAGSRLVRRTGGVVKVGDDVLVISAAPENVAGADASASAVAVPPTHIGPARLVFRTGLLVSLGLMLIFYLDRNTTNATIFGFLAIVFFLMLLRISRSRSPAP